MTPREQTLTQIARLYTDLTDPQQAGNGNGDSGLRLMPATYTPTVKEYERLVKQMRDDRSEKLLELKDKHGVAIAKLSVRSAWWHLEHWHHRAQRVIKHEIILADVKHSRRKVRVLDSNGKPTTQPTIGYLRDPKASEARAALAITWIAAHWNLPTEPMLPAAVTEGYKAAA